MRRMRDLPASDPSLSEARRSKFGLTRLFAVAGLLAIGVFAVAMALLLGRFLESRLLDRDGEASREIVQSIASMQQVAAVLSDSDDTRAARDPKFAAFIAHLSAMPGMLRINVYSPQRKLLWSTRPEMIGRSFGANDELDLALGGAVVVHSAAGPDKAEHLLLGARHDYVENYVPVVDANERVIAVVELYRRPDALFAAIRSGQRLVAWGAAAGGLFLFACLNGFVRHAEHRLREQQRRVVEAEAMAIVGEISAAVAHSIRNPLGSIRSSAELQRELGGDADGRQTGIMRDADRIEGLVRSMLAYAAASPARPARADLGSVVADVAGCGAADLGRQGKRLELDLQRGLGRVDAEPVLLQQMLQTLLTNAAEATQAGGRIRLHTHRDGANATVEVSDNGVGIAPQDMGRVLEPFQTTKPNGLGMGLALAHRVARRLGGDIDIASVPGQGTRVRLTLPVLAA
jgi:signal transduction histidine kinase